MPFNRKLKIMMIAKPISQADLSLLTRIAESRLSRIVNNRVVPSAAERERIAKQLGCKPSDLFEKQ